MFAHEIKMSLDFDANAYSDTIMHSISHPDQKNKITGR